LSELGDGGFGVQRKKSQRGQETKPVEGIRRRQCSTAAQAKGYKAWCDNANHLDKEGGLSRKKRGE